MKHLAPAFVALILAASAAMAGVDPALLGLVMPEAKVVAGAQVDQAQASPFGRYLLGQFQPGADFDKLVAASGFDPRRDLREIVAASMLDNQSLVVVRGVFQPGRIAAMAVAGGATSSSYRGIELLSNLNQDGQSAAFLDASTAIAGTTAQVKAAVDRRMSNTTYSGALADKVRAVSGANDVWVVTQTPIADFLGQRTNGALPPNSPQAGAIGAIQQVAGGLRFGGDAVTLNGEALTRSNQDAQALVDVLKFVVSMVQLNNNNPNAAKLAAALNGATFTADGATLRLTLSVPQQQLEELMKPQPRGARRKAAAL